MSEYIKHMLLNGVEYEIDDAEARAGVNACLIKPTETGSVINIPDGAEMPLQAMSIDSSESVDVTVCGKNLINLSTFVKASAGCTATVVDDTILANCNATGTLCLVGLNAGQGTTSNLTANYRVLKSTGAGNYKLQYKINGATATNTNGGYWCGFYAADGTFLSSFDSDHSGTLLMPVPEGCVWIAFNIFVRNCVAGETYIISDLQLEKADVETDYEPYTSQTVTVSVDGNEWQSLHTYIGTSNITNNLNAEMQLTYVADTKKYIDNKFNDLQNAILSSGANV